MTGIHAERLQRQHKSAAQAKEWIDRTIGNPDVLHDEALKASLKWIVDAVVDGTFYFNPKDGEGSGNLHGMQYGVIVHRDGSCLVHT